LKLDSYPSRDQLSLFSDSVFRLSQKCSDNFILFYKSIIQSSVDILSKSGLEVPCSFAVVALGSVARGTATPYSDLEYAFVVKSNSHSDYFTKLAVDSYFRIGNMMESPLKCFDIAEIDKTYSDDAAVGFHIDGISEKAGNIPTGKGDGAKNLILTVEQLADVYTEGLLSPAGKTADIGDLLSSCVLVSAYQGGDTLFENVTKTFHNILIKETSNVTLIKKRLQILGNDAKMYDFSPRFESFGSPDNTKLKVKPILFRYPTLLVDHLRLLLGHSETTPWAVSEQLKNLEFLDEKQCSTLNLVSALAIYARTVACLQLQSQQDEFSLYPGIGSNRKVYSLPHHIFALMTFTVAPMKLCIAKNLNHLANLNTTDKFDVMKHLIKDLGVQQPSFMLKAEIEYFCGCCEQAIKTIKTNCKEEVFAKGPDVFVSIVKKAVKEDMKTEPTSMPLTESYRLEELKTSKLYVELAAYLLFSAHRWELSVQYFIWLTKNSRENPIDELKWKILATDCANKLHSYSDSFSLLDSVYSSLKAKFGKSKGQTLYRFVKQMSTSSAISCEDLHWFELTAQAFRVLSQACQNTKIYLQAEEMANAAILLFDRLHASDEETRFDSHYVELIVSLALIHSEKGEHKRGIEYLNHYLNKLVKLHTDCVDHPDIAVILGGLGHIYENIRDYTRSLHFYKRALSMTDNLHTTTDHVSVAQCYRDVAVLETKRSNYQAALSSYQIVRDAYDRLDVGRHERASLLVEMADLYSCMEDHDSALSSLGSALGLLESTGEITHIDIADVHTAYGKVYSRMGKKEHALRHHTISLEKTRNKFDEIKETPILAQFYGEMGNFSIELGIQAQSLNIKKSSKEPKSVHPEIASCYLRVGRLYREMCLYDQSLQYINMSCDMFRDVHKETNHTNLASAYGELGSVYYSMGEYSKALEYHTKSLEMELAVYGSEATHADIATSYGNIGSVYYNMAQYSMALEYHKKSLNMRLAVYGTEATHADIATSYNNIGSVSYSMSEYSKALEHYTKSLDMRIAVYGTDATHEDIATSYNNIGLVYYNMGRDSKALEYYIKALDMMLAVYGTETTHAHIATSYNNIGLVYKKMGEYSKALEYYTKSLEMMLAVYGTEVTHADIATRYGNIGCVYDDLGEYSKALEYYTKSLEMMLAVYGSEATHADIATNYGNIGSVYYNMGEYSNALEYYKKSLKMELAVYGTEATHANIATSYNNIGSVYYKMGDGSKALEYLMKSASIN